MSNDRAEPSPTSASRADENDVDDNESTPIGITESVLTGKFESELELLKRHIILLKAIRDQQPIGIIRLAETLDLPQHKVRYSLRLLEQEGLIAPSAEGAVTTERFADLLSQLFTALNSSNKELNEILEMLEKF